MTRIVKRGGMETGVARGEGVEGEVDSGGDATGGVECDVDEWRGMGQTMSWKDVNSTTACIDQSVSPMSQRY